MKKVVRQQRQKVARATHKHTDTNNPIAIRLQPIVLASLNELCEQHKLSRNAFVNEAVSIAITRVARQKSLVLS